MKFILIVLLAAGLIIAGCSQQPVQSPQQGSGTPQPPSGGSQQPPSQQQGGAQQQGSGADAELQACINGICGIGNDSMTRICTVSCWDDYAVATKDAKQCDKNFELINSSLGYNVCVEAVAKASADAAPCGLIKGELYRDLCYVEVAKYLKDESVCANVDDADPMLTKQDCLNALKE